LKLYTSDSLNVANQGPQIAALDLVRQLPAVAILELYASTDNEDAGPVQWPPFIPSSLRDLRIEVQHLWKHSRVVESLLPALPGIIGTSGAKLDRLAILFPSEFEAIGDGLIHVAKAVRGCSSTLTAIRLGTSDEGNNSLLKVFGTSYTDQEFAVLESRLRVQWADVLAGVSSCRELQLLLLPRITSEPSFPPGAAFHRLTQLVVTDGTGWDPPHTGVVGLWEVMASGGLTTLAKLNLTLEGKWGDRGKVRTRMAPALEAVAGTLTHLEVVKSGGDGC
jgi:hypothetical protein